MIRPTRRYLVLLLGILAIPTVGGALAWACSPDADIGVDAAVADVGQAVLVSGNAFFVRNASNEVVGATVELRWDSAAGPVLAYAVGPSFAASVTIPQAVPGAHQIVAISKRPGSEEVVGGDQAAIRIGAPAQQAPAVGTQRETTAPATRGSVSGGGAPQAAAAPAPAPARAPRAAADTAAQTSGSVSGRASPRATAARRPQAAVRPRPQPQRQQALTRAVADRTARSGATAAARSGARGAAARQAAARAPESSAFADPWSGFASPTGPALAASASEVVIAPGGSGGPRTALLLLGLALVALLGGAAAVRSERRSRVRPPLD